jgi:hypothetical protein
MRLLRMTAAAAALAVVSAAALVGQSAAPAGVQMADAASKFLAALPPELRQKATFDYDSPERTKWHFVPLQDKDRKPTRKGVRLEELSDDQKQAAMALLRAGTSPKGFEQATAIMSLEKILFDLEQNKGPVRNTGWYFVSVFGEPSKTGPWGWRFEGHHLSLNVTLDGGQVVTATPSVFAANPAEVMDGTKKGQRTVPEVDDLARQLVDSLDAGQKKVALRDKPFPEINPTPVAQVGPPEGISYGKLTQPQQATLRKLMEAYTGRMPAAVGAAEWAAAEKAGLDKVHFAFSGGTGKGQPHTYRVQGPTFLIEFLNVQADAAKNPANHIHSGWRHLPTDFGLKGT